MAATKHVAIATLAEQTGMSARWFTRMAVGGKIPGAVQPGGPGGAWRFDERQFWAWWNSRTRRAANEWQTSTSAGNSGGDVSAVRAVNSASPLRQRLKALRESASRGGSASSNG